MAQALTERQQEIRQLLDQKKTPREIGEILGISENAVYQHRRRIRNNGTAKRRGRPPGSKTKRAEARADQPTPERPAKAPEVKVLTPLQAIRSRKAEIEAAVKEREREFDEAQRIATKTHEALEQTRAKVSDELAKLEAAENALTGVQPQRPAKRRSRPAKALAETPPAPDDVTASNTVTANGQPEDEPREVPEFAQATRDVWPED